MVLPLFFPAALILRFAGSEGAKNLAGKCPPPDSNPFSDTESGKISLGCQAAKSRNPESPIPVPETRSAFHLTHDETFFAAPVNSLLREARYHHIRAGMGASFTHPIPVSSLASVAGGINIHSGIVRLCRNQHVIAVDVDVGRGRPAPSETHRIYSSHLFLLGPELERSRRRSWRRRRRGRTGLCAVSPAGVHLHAVFIKSPPNDHFTAGPHCRVIGSGIGRVGPAGGHPTVSAWIVSPAGIQPAAAAPDDHFAASPDCCVNNWAVRRIGSGGCRPAVRARIISAVGVVVQG